MTERGQPNLKVYVALLVVYLVWGTTLGAMRIGVDTIPPALLACVRYLVAGLLLIGFCLLRGEKWPNREVVRIHCIVGALLFFGGNALSNWAVQHIPTGFGGIMVGATPFWMVAMASRVPPREPISMLSRIGIGIGFIGIIILLSPKLQHPETTSSLFWLGLLSFVLMSICWSAGSIYARKRPTSTSLLLGLGIQNLCAGLLTAPIYGLTEAHIPVQPSTPSLLALLFLILMGTIVATSCYLYVLKTLPISVTSTFAYVTPVITVLFGWLFLNEPITPLMVLGAAVILSGVVLVQCANRRPEPDKSLYEPEDQPVVELVKGTPS